MPAKVGWTLFQQTIGVMRIMKLANANHSNLAIIAIYRSNSPHNSPFPYSIVMGTLNYIPRTPVTQLCEPKACFPLCSSGRRQKYSSICYHYSLIVFRKHHLCSMPIATNTAAGSPLQILWSSAQWLVPISAAIVLTRPYSTQALSAGFRRFVHDDS